MTDYDISADLAGNCDLGADLTGDVPVAAALAGRGAFGANLSNPLGSDVRFITQSQVCIMPSGLAVIPYQNVPGPFHSNSGEGTFNVYVPLPGAMLTLQGFGVCRLDDLPSSVGTISAEITTSTAGSNMLVAMLVDTTGATPLALGIALDTSNRPYAVIMNLSGTVIGRTTPSGGAIGSGVVLRIRMAWNSISAISGTRHASLTVNGILAPNGEWTTNPTTPWNLFRPKSVYLGVPFGSMSAFNGTLTRVEVGRRAV